ncbi:MAG: peptidoglycan DD-metalloendopeptidase family protein [Flavobacteriales bacterium]|nr:peptidoglycan DD-metalloendopeptidase family protein [Flavobacteriales bacterium]
MKNILIYFLFFLIITLQGCRENKSTSHNGNSSADSNVQEKEIIDTSTIYGYTINNYFIDSNQVEPNQGLSHLLPKYGVSQKTIFNIATNYNEIFDFRKIKPNKKYFMIQERDSLKTPVCFVYELNSIEYVTINLKDSIEVKRYKRKITTTIEQSGGVIESSLWNAFIKNELSPALVMEVAKLYAWTIDFFGIQKGDSFKVIYEAKYVNHQFIGVGEIKAFLFNHRKNDFYSFRYEKDSIDEFGYFNEKGESMKKALLSAPLEYKRISSKFSNRRLHPITRKYRPHHGVDYAAPTGTNVVATGDGTVIFAATSGGAGKMVKIKHSVGNILTKYLHLSRYGKGIKKGVFVKQGQKIGEVGNTGMSTGPHLDYRIYINGKAVDPLGIDIPTLDPITTENMQQFLKVIDPIKKQLDSISLQ